MNKKTALVAAIIISMAFLMACGKKETIIGEWANDNGARYVFNEDGSGEISVAGYSVKATYTIDNDNITIITVLLGQEQKDEYKFEITDGKLKLMMPGAEIELNRQ